VLAAVLNKPVSATGGSVTQSVWQARTTGSNAISQEAIKLASSQAVHFSPC